MSKMSQSFQGTPHAKNDSLHTIAILLVFFICGVLMMQYGTRWGLGLSDDSYFYLYPAVDFSQGLGWSINFHYPPLVTAVLLIPTAFGIDPLHAFRYINILLYATNCVVFCLVIYYISKSNLLVILSGAGYLCLGVIFELHAWAMSEALFVNLTLMGILFLLLWIRLAVKPYLFLSALCFGLSITTRYLGITGLAAGTLIVFICSKKQRGRNTLGYLVTGALPAIILFIGLWIRYGVISDRKIAIYPLNYGLINQGINAFVTSFIPGRFVNGFETIWLVGLIVILIVLGLALILSYRDQDLANRIISPAWLLACYGYAFVVIYLFTVCIGRAFFDPLIPFDDRLLSPVVIVSILLIAALLTNKWSDFGTPLKSVIILFITGLVAMNSIRSYQLIQSYHDSGRGYSSARDHVSETYRYLRLHPDAPIYSNAPAALYFWLGRHTQPLPGEDQLTEMRAVLKASDGFVVIFDSIPLELYHLTLDEVTQGMEPVIDLSEATIYHTTQ